MSVIDYSKVNDILSEICESVKSKSNGKGFQARCPVCGDSQKHKKIQRLHVDYYTKYDNWIARCYNGGCPISGSTNIISLYSRVKGISFIEAKKLIQSKEYNTDKIKERLLKNNNTKSEEIIKENLDIDIDKDCYSINSIISDRIGQRYIEALKKFVNNRQINFPCYIAYKGRYKGRVIIPIFIDGILKFFQGRSLFDNMKPKYLNPNSDKLHIILNSDKFSKDKFIIVTEGVIDAWMIEDNQGTSFLGAYLSDEFIETVSKYTDKGIVVCFDNPLIDEAGREEILKFIENSKFSKEVQYFLPNRTDFKDLNDLKLLGQIDNIYNYVISQRKSSFYVQTSLKLS